MTKDVSGKILLRMNWIMPEPVYIRCPSRWSRAMVQSWNACRKASTSGTGNGVTLLSQS